MAGWRYYWLVNWKEGADSVGNPGTGVRAAEGKVLIGNQAGAANITKSVHGFLPLVYGLLDGCFKSHDLVLEAFYFPLQFITPSIGYPFVISSCPDEVGTPLPFS
jgi:hypothetical protein